MLPIVVVAKAAMEVQHRHHQQTRDKAATATEASIAVHQPRRLAPMALSSSLTRLVLAQLVKSNKQRQKQTHNKQE